MSARVTSMALINRVGGNRTTSWLSLEVSTSSLWDPFVIPVWPGRQDRSPIKTASSGLVIRIVCVVV